MGHSSSLDPTEIHLWLTYYDEICDTELQSAYRDLLTDDERRQESRFYFARDRTRYLVTRALVRTVLSQYVSVQPKNWTFVTNAYGRPEADNEEARAVGLAFNVSHTHSLIVLGVTQNRALGVDTENTVARNVSVDIADRFFAPTEVSALATVSAERQQYRFFEYWTFKESYIKARGMGLSLPLDKFAFQFVNDRKLGLTVDPELSDDPRRWMFWQFSPRSEYLIAVCAERVQLSPVTISMREIVPLRHEKTLATVPLRTSE